MRLRASAGASEPPAFVAASLAAFMAVTAFVAAHHEMWRDEADVWLFTRDGNFAHLTDWTRHAGTPALWYLLVAPLARLGAAYWSQQVLHLVVIWAAAAIFLRRAPLPRATKLLALFSYYFLYEYAIVVRSYALTILLVAIAAAWHTSRAERPWRYALVLALLSNVNAHGFLLAAALALLFVIDTRQWKPAVLIAIGAVIAWLQVRAPADPMRVGAKLVFRPSGLLWLFGDGLLPMVPIAAGVVVAAAILVLLTLTLRGSRLFLWAALGALSALHSLVWIGGLRHAGFVLIIILVAVWISSDAAPRYEQATALLLNGALLISLAEGARTAILDVRLPFSGAKEMAHEIRRAGLQDCPIAAHNLTQAEAVLAYLPPRTFWYAGLARDGSYMTWDVAFDRALDCPFPVAERRAQQHFGSRRDWLLLYNVEMPDPEQHGFRLLYRTAEPFEKTDERFWLYAPLP
jgi:hypothetical protein